jgi:hypothetical protein
MNRIALIVAAVLFAIALVVLVRPTHRLPPGPTAIPPPAGAGG